MNLIEVNNLNFSYDETRILDDINFKIKKNDFVLINGNNGSGKSTLLKIIIGELKNYYGEVRILDIDLRNFKHWEKIGYVPQVDRQNHINFPISVRELIMLNLYYDFNLFNLPRKRHYTMVEDVILAFNLGKIADKNFNDLSGGQKQRVMIAKAMVHNPEILIFDEPTVGVDKENRETFYKLIEHLHQHHNITIILVSHEADINVKNINRRFVLDEKVIKEYV